MKTKQVDQPTWLFSDFDYGLVTLLCHENTKKIQCNDPLGFSSENRK